MAALPDYTTEYVRHALALIRVANGLNADALSGLRSLGRDLRKLLAGEDIASMGVVDLRSLIKLADNLIVEAFDELLLAQTDAVASLIVTESKWALNVAGWNTAPTEQAIQRAIAQFSVMGKSLEDELNLIRDRMQSNVAASIRLGAGAALTDSEIISEVSGLGGSVDAAYRILSGVIDAATMAAADQGRRLTMKANGVTSVQWHAVLEVSSHHTVCADCAERDGWVWTIDGKPVGHSIPYMPIPLHPRCHCIYIPMELDTEELAAVKKSPPTRFADWLETLSTEDQDAVLGKGRAELWRNGTITLADLIDQNGYVMSLADLQESIK